MRASVVLGVLATLLGLVIVSSTGAERPPRKPDRPAEKVERYPCDTDADHAVRVRLARMVPEVAFDGAAFEAVLAEIRAFGQVNLVVNWAALEASAVERDAEISLRARNVRLDKLLRLILDELGAGEFELGYEISDGVVYISTLEDLSRRRIVVVYDCADFLRIEEEHLARYLNRVLENVHKHTGRNVSKDVEAIERLVRGAIRDSRWQLEQELTEAIVASIDPESWRAAGGSIGTIKRVGTQLVIGQRRAVHERVFALLSELRAARPMRPASAYWP